MKLRAADLNRITLAAIAGAVVLVTGGWIAYARSGASVGKSTAKQQAAAMFEYPTPSDNMPKAITTDYSVAKDRSTMTLALGSLPANAPIAFRTAGASLVIRSEFSGRTRDPSQGELSVRMTLSVKSIPAGVLAPSSPIAEFVANGHAFHTRGPSDHSSGYRTAKANAPESLDFRVSTKDLIAIAHANSATLKAGAAVVTLSSHEMSLLREFVARMNPRLAIEAK